MIPILSNLCHFAGSVRKWSGSSLTCVLGWPCLKRIRILYGMCHCTRTVSKIIRILWVILHDLSKNDPDPVWTASLFRICLKMIRILSAILQDVPEKWSGSCLIMRHFAGQLDQNDPNLLQNFYFSKLWRHCRYILLIVWKCHVRILLFFGMKLLLTGSVWWEKSQILSRLEYKHQTASNTFWMKPCFIGSRESTVFRKILRDS